MSASTLTFVTGNANKLREVQEILTDGAVPLVIESRNIDCMSVSSLLIVSANLTIWINKVPEIQGTAVEVSREKCRRAAEIVGGPCITEDTSLGFVALNGLPGPYIKWFLREVGTEDGFETRAAFAQCNFAYSEGPGSEPIVFEGRTEGNIVRPRGPSKFGWDPVFEPLEGDGKTSYQELYEFLTKPVSNGSDKKVDNLIKSRLPQLRKCTNPFGPPNPESKKSLESGRIELADGTTLSVSDEDRQEALAVSARFQLDEIEALVLLRSCLIHAEHSTLGTTTSATWDADLKDALESYYFQQRLHVLRVFLPILTASGDPEHPFHVVATDAKQSIMPDDGAFALDLIDELDRRTRQTLLPSVASDPRAASRWARQGCREQICLLEVLFGVLWELDHCPSNLVVRLFEVLFSTDSGQAQANSNYLMDEEGCQLLSDLESFWILVGLQVLALGRVTEGATVGKELLVDPVALHGLHNQIIGSFRLKPRYAPLLMAWSILLSYLSLSKEPEKAPDSFANFYKAVIPPAPATPFYQQCAEIALSSEAGLFAYLSQLLDSPVLCSTAAASKASGVTTPNAYTYRLTIHYLVIGMADTLQLGYMSDVDAFLEVVVKLFGSGEYNIVASLGRMYWTEDWVQSPKRQQLLQVAALRFPVQPRPLVRLLRALSGSGDDSTSNASGSEAREVCVKHVYQYFAEMTGFAHVIQPSHLQSSAYDVRSDMVLNVRPIQLPGGTTLPARSAGQTLSLRSPGAPLA
ncbi:hypothetical protein FRC07_004781, partial [Ceratobasidium sp. 392]